MFKETFDFSGESPLHEIALDGFSAGLAAN
jgi:hypothetical protein